MTPTHAIETLDDQLAGPINSICNGLSDEAVDILQEWAGLGSAGGQRDDHAAALLSRLLPRLRSLATRADVCAKQLAAMMADPFGKE